MTNARIAEVLDQIADLLEFEGANPFRVRAYRNAGRVVHDLPEAISDILASPDRKLTDIDGIGADLAEKITTLVGTGKLPFLEELLARTPESVLALLRIAGLGPKKAAVLYKELGVKTLADLKAACESHRVQELKGFGAKTEQIILAGMELAQTAADRMLWADADAEAQALLAHFKPLKAVKQIAMAGSYRRGRETVGDLDILVDSDDMPAVMDHFAKLPAVKTLVARGDTKMSVRLDSGLGVDLRVVPAKSFGAALQYFTGSKDHNVVLRGMAKDRGLKINEYGIFRGEKYLAGKTEEEIYAALDLPCFAPEIREARQEFAWAAAGELPKLVELADIRGDLHMHTTESDGNNTLEEMAAAAKTRGLKYIAITDHSQRATIANGLTPERLKKLWKRIDKFNATDPGILVLKGVECDILEKGGLDLPDDVLAEADWVICSVHYGQNQTRAQITARILEAIEHPHVAAIAHPTGRLINRRKPYEVDLEAVFTAAAKHHKLLELNATPQRLDLSDIQCAAAKRHGVKIVIGTDSHRVESLAQMRVGIIQARRAGLTKEDVANTRTWGQLQKLIGKK
ncbi:MAG: DNA polymerase/3'-5' exonuclease PolX [Planctomycetia bacterium]|nr:DNA polymerase/3'-5' exonuclease PolX [Planctomycetia bacterium]